LKHFTFLFTLLTSTMLSAQEALPPMVTDRPDQTESAETVPAGHLQFETGAAYEHDENDNRSVERYTFNTSLLRFGLTEGLEARLGGAYSVIETTPHDLPTSTTIEGTGPLYTGFKAMLHKEKGFMPAVAFLGSLSLPFTASGDFKAGHPAPGMRLAFAHTLGGSFSLGYNFGAEWDGDAPSALYPYSIALGFGATERLGLFAESYGYLSDVGPPDHRADGGLTYLVAPGVQADVSGGIGITELSPDYFVSLGFSLRI
jgi:hypothetical protein